MNYSSALLQLPNAVDYAAFATDATSTVDHSDLCGVAWHYGNPLGEQRLLELADATHPAFVDRSHRHVVAVTGPDAAEYLNNLFSQLLLDLPAGTTRAALDFDAQGHILHHFQLLRTEEGFLVDVAASQAESLLAYLQRMVFWSQVEIAATDLARIDVYGSSELPAAFTSPAEQTYCTALLGTPLAPTPSGATWYMPRAELAGFGKAAVAAGWSPVGLLAHTAQRARQLQPELAIDLDAKAIAHEVPHFINREEHVGAVHLHKGCYRGQETVSRVENLGRPPRQLVCLQLDGSAPSLPEPGAEIMAGKRRVGRVGTVVQDYEYGPVALALVKQSALTQPLHVGEMAVTIDPDSLRVAQPEQRGKQAIAQLKGNT